MNQSSETHPLEPFFPKHARILMCGTFPPSRNRWSMEFYYPNFINDMWRIFGLIYFNDKEHFVDQSKRTFRLPELRHFLEKEGIALSDTGREIVREKGNAADKHLLIKSHIDLPEVLTLLPQCDTIVTTGEKAADVVARITETTIPKTGEYVDCSLQLSDNTTRNLRHWRMPSSSRAYPLRLEKKAEMYARVFHS